MSETGPRGPDPRRLLPASREGLREAGRALHDGAVRSTRALNLRILRFPCRSSTLRWSSGIPLVTWPHERWRVGVESVTASEYPIRAIPLFGAALADSTEAFPDRSGHRSCDRCLDGHSGLGRGAHDMAETRTPSGTAWNQSNGRLQREFLRLPSWHAYEQLCLLPREN